MRFVAVASAAHTAGAVDIGAIAERYLSDKADAATAEASIKTLQPGSTPNDLAREAQAVLYGSQ